MRKFEITRRLSVALAVMAIAVAAAGCQKPTDSSDTNDVNDFVDASTPTAVANPSTDGRSYRVTRNNEADLIVAYQFKTTFTITVTMNGNSNASKYDLSFPITLSQASVKVNQASGGIVTPPTGSDTERSEFVISQASGNKFAAANTSLTMTFDVWYTMPSQQKESLITATFNMTDNDGKAFTKTATINVAP